MYVGITESRVKSIAASWIYLTKVHNVLHDMCTSFDRTALMVAASNGDKDMVDLLVKYQASLNLQSHVIDVCMECDFDTFIHEELQHLFNPKILDSGAT